MVFFPLLVVGKGVVAWVGMLLEKVSQHIIDRIGGASPFDFGIMIDVFGSCHGGKGQIRRSLTGRLARSGSSTERWLLLLLLLLLQSICNVVIIIIIFHGDEPSVFSFLAIMMLSSSSLGVERRLALPS